MLALWKLYLLSQNTLSGFAEILLNHPWREEFHNPWLHLPKSLCGGVKMDIWEKLCWDPWNLHKISTSYSSFRPLPCWHRGNFTSLIILALRNLSTSSWMIEFLSGENFLRFLCIGLKLGSTFNLLIIISLDILVISSRLQENVDFLSYRNMVRFCLRSWSRSMSSRTLMSESFGVSMTCLTSLIWSLEPLVPFSLTVRLAWVWLSFSLMCYRNI